MRFEKGTYYIGDLGDLVHFEKDFDVSVNMDGTFTFGHLTIITDGSDVEEEEYEDDEY